MMMQSRDNNDDPLANNAQFKKLSLRGHMDSSILRIFLQISI